MSSKDNKTNVVRSEERLEVLIMAKVKRKRDERETERHGDGLPKTLLCLG